MAPATRQRPGTVVDNLARGDDMRKRTRYFPRADTLAEALALRYEVQVDGCWMWRGGRKATGYGSLTWNGDTKSAHQWAWLVANGLVPEGLELDHLCRVKLCVNPAHLDAVTPAENARRAAPYKARGKANNNGAKTHCLHGHPYEGANLYVSGGRRYCRTCKRERMARYRAAL